ncbi:hypothetical protein BJY52DRAFT_1231120 [Lactarius psammicola]|nr:hypothetical protein BJY52DRAFT_1231120 [Lactarius psammicola]
MSSYMHNSFGNGFKNGSLGDVGYQASESQGRWQFNGMGNSAGAGWGTFGTQGVQNTDMVASTVTGAPEAFLEHNAFYIGLKRLTIDQRTEIDTLKLTIGLKDQEIESRAKEFDKLKARCETLEGIKWRLRHSQDESQVGCPSKKDNTVCRKNMYLQGHDGIPVSAEKLTKLSNKARSVWEFLLEKKMAPVTFSKISYNAWDFYARAILNDPELDFLLLCDDVQWKLKEWSTQNYSGWAGNRGVRLKNIGQKTNKNSNTDILDDPALIRMKTSSETDDSNGNVESANHTSESGDSGYKETTPELNNTDDSESEVGEELEENASPLTQPVCNILTILSSANTRSKVQGLSTPATPVINNPLYSFRSGIIVSSLTYPPQCTHDIELSVNKPHRTFSNKPREPRPHSHGQRCTPPCQTAKYSELIKTVNITLWSNNCQSYPQHSGYQGTNSATNNTLGDTSASEMVAKSTVMQKSQDIGPVAPTVPSKSTQTPAAGPPNSQNTVPDHPNPTPTSAPLPNLHLDIIEGNMEKKRKAKGKNTPTASKKQKTSNALAEPTSAISIRNICMCHWNEQQPGGQGLTTDFDIHFKGLSKEDKEPFQTAMHIAQGVARKAKTAAKKASEVPLVD